MDIRKAKCLPKYLTNLPEVTTVIDNQDSRRCAYYGCRSWAVDQALDELSEEWGIPL